MRLSKDVKNLFSFFDFKNRRRKDSGKSIPLESNYLMALKWIYENRVNGSGASISNLRKTPYPEVTGYLIPTLINWGETDMALQFAHWLNSIQNSDGSWSDPSFTSGYTFDTGQVLKGLMSILPRLPEAEEPIRRGCDWMLTQIQPNGRITTPDKSAWNLPGGKLVSENIHLYALEPLQNASKYFKESRYAKAVEHAIAYYTRQSDLTSFNTLSHFHAYVMEALVDCGQRDLAAKGMAFMESIQKRRGSVPAYPKTRWVCSPAVAQYAVTWYKLGHRKPAEKAFEYVSRIQNRSGGFYGSYGRCANYFPKEEISWAVKYFLDAIYWHIRTAFDTDSTNFPDKIDQRDGRFLEVQKIMGSFSSQRILDAGCGKGRIAKELLSRNPSVEIWGVDISDTMLSYVPPNVKTKQGSLLNLPFDDGYFDYVYSVEALEHAINPEAAIKELCRVLKPGGHILVVDKNVKHQGALEIEAWERWFYKSEVETWLRRYCYNVGSEYIVYGEKTEPDGLFISWHAIRE